MSQASLVKNNTIQGNGGGMYINGTGIRVESNALIDNRDFGVEIFHSSGNAILNNVFVNNGLLAYGSRVTEASGNTVNGKPLRFYEGASHVVVSGDAGQVVLVNCRYVTVVNLTVGGVETGILLWETHNSTIRGVTTENNSWFGVRLMYSSNNTVEGNLIRSNRVGGIELSWSSKNTLKGNLLKENGVAGIALASSSMNLIEGNIVEGSGKTGISLDGSYGNLVFGNTIRGNIEGLFFYNSALNRVVGNTVRGNKGGLTLYNSSSNSFYHNGFEENGLPQVHVLSSANTWDDERKGNYWSDHKCADPNGDGICDNPYFIDQGNVDRYPLAGAPQLPEEQAPGGYPPPQQEEQPQNALAELFRVFQFLLIALLLLALLVVALMLVAGRSGQRAARPIR